MPRSLSPQGIYTQDRLLELLASGDWMSTQELCAGMGTFTAERTAWIRAHHCQSCTCGERGREAYVIEGRYRWYPLVYSTLKRLTARGVVERHESPDGFRGVMWSVAPGLRTNLDEELRQLLGGSP